MKTKNAAERKRAERKRHKDAGRAAVTVHVRREYMPEVRALESELQRRERDEISDLKDAGITVLPGCGIITERE